MGGTDLYKRIMQYAETDEERGHLLREIWEGMPWMTYVHTPIGSDQYCEVKDWCNANIGPEREFFFDRPGVWQYGNASVDGWIWIGFANESDLLAFIERFNDITDGGPGDGHDHQSD